MALQAFLDRIAKYTTSDQRPYSYLIFASPPGVYPKMYFARNGLTGDIEFSGTDASAVIQSAINALTNGGKIFIKSGTYDIYSTLNIPYDGISIEGENRKTVLRDNIISGHLLFAVGRSRVDIRHLKLEVAVTKATGDEMSLNNCAYSNFEDLEFDLGGKGFNAIYISTNSWSLYFSDIRIFNVRDNGIVNVDSSDIFFSKLLVQQFGPNIGMGSALTIFSTGGFTVTDADLLGLYRGVNVMPGANQICEWLFFKTVMADSCADSGWYFGGLGTIRGVVIIDGWGSSNNHGMQFSNGKYITLIAPRAFNNKSVGIVVDGADHVDIMAPQVTANSRIGAGVNPGIYLATSNNKIIGGFSKEGVFSGYAAQQSYGINVATAVTNVLIAYVDLRDNLYGAIQNPANLGEGSRVVGCPGFVTDNSGTATITAGATYVDVTHGLDITPDINRIKVTPKDNLGGRSFWVSNVTATTFRINISSSDTVDHAFGWSYE